MSSCERNKLVCNVFGKQKDIWIEVKFHPFAYEWVDLRLSLISNGSNKKEWVKHVKRIESRRKSIFDVYHLLNR